MPYNKGKRGKREGERGEIPMSRDLTTVYRAKNLQEAQLLCNTLEDEGIRAMVANASLGDGAAVEMFGWPTLARVVVEKEDAVRAREIAVDFDRRIYGDVRDEELKEYHRLDETPADWPLCPKCNKRRTARCEFCGATGDDFSPADAADVDLLGLPATPPDAAGCCSCGPGGCGSNREEMVQENAEPSSEANAPSPEETPSTPLLLCPTCDEPFTPRYLKRCGSCGYEFEDGEDIAPEPIITEPLNRNVRHTFFVLFFGFFLWAICTTVVGNPALGFLVVLGLIGYEVIWLLVKRKNRDNEE
jgi:hypothetical protein